LEAIPTYHYAQGRGVPKKQPAQRSAGGNAAIDPIPSRIENRDQHTPKGKRTTSTRSCITERGNAAIDPILHGSKIATNIRLLHQTYAHVIPKGEARKRRDPIMNRKPPSYAQRREISNKQTTSKTLSLESEAKKRHDPIMDRKKGSNTRAISKVTNNTYAQGRGFPNKRTAKGKRLTLIPRSEKLKRRRVDPITDR
jgi:hypothetical protein